ncbi:hypothetical protein DM56_4097 [Burkholderia mallei]|nr:hypothetical protein DM56_4097 [Burkholderia mallei]
MSGISTGFVLLSTAAGVAAPPFVPFAPFDGLCAAPSDTAEPVPPSSPPHAASASAPSRDRYRNLRLFIHILNLELKRNRSVLHEFDGQ